MTPGRGVSQATARVEAGPVDGFVAAAEDVPPFDLTGPLPQGLTVLEASAGTGKTFTIAGLATRYVAEGTPLDQLLVVTFTRAATGELRDRVRQRLVHTERQLQHILDERPPDESDRGDASALLAEAAVADVAGGDPVVAVLATGSRAQVAERHRALDVAIAEFDAATITTTHGFCQHMLASLGTAGDTERAATFSEDADDLIDEVVDDLYLRKYAKSGGAPFSRREARRFVAKAVLNPGADIDRSHAPVGHPNDMREKMTEAARREVEQRKLERGTLGYDDLLTRLQATLADPRRGPAAAERLRARYKVALVDEFQDTDPIQWDILRRAFVHPDATLVLIGDPKQAIYSFRGADVWSYLQAAREADARATLATNWRSDKSLLDGVDTLLQGSALGHPEITYRHVEAAAANRGPGLSGVQPPEALRFRVLQRADGIALTDSGFARKPAARERIARDVAAEAGLLLSSEARLVRRDHAGLEVGRRDLHAGDLAVLVFTNSEAGLVRDALEAAGVPAVLNGSGSVLDTETARQWLRLLEALERPASASRARAVALTPFVGWPPDRLATGDDDDLEALQAELHRWAGVLARDGVAALVEQLSARGDLPARLLAQPDGERQLTDIHHVAQLLHAEAVGAGLGSPALAGWLRRRITEAANGVTAEERSRRLESDAEAVQVLTIHRSKGLEWPVVYLPFLWGNGPDDPDPIPVFHDPATHQRRVDVRGRSSPHLKRYTEERRGEDLRLAYVALTRARNQAIVWWASSLDSRQSPLGRLLFGTRTPAGMIAPGPRDMTDGSVVTQLELLAARAPGCVAVEHLEARPAGPVRRGAAPEGQLSVRHFTRPIDTSWRRTSYTAISDGDHSTHARGSDGGPSGAVASEPDAVGLADEPAIVASEMPEKTFDPALDSPVALSELAGGALLGTLVHAVMERVDFAADDIDIELATHLSALLPRIAPTLTRQPDVVVGALLPALRGVLETPLGPDLDELRLRDVPRSDRLDEVGFEFPLAGQGGRLGVRDLAGRIAAWLPDDDPLRAYPEHLALLDSGEVLRGYLTGSIDLVLRRRDRRGAARYVVVDYKTNRLAPRGEPLRSWHYRPDALANAMHEAHYPLQALLYSVALHRYLRGRQAAYDPGIHLGGVRYLFLRGMTGPATARVGGQPCGVFRWAPPVGLIVELSDLLDRGAS